MSSTGLRNGSTAGAALAAWIAVSGVLASGPASAGERSAQAAAPLNLKQAATQLRELAQRLQQPIRSAAPLPPIDNPEEVRVVIQSGHASAIDSVAISGDGRYLLSAGRDATAKLWDVASGREVRTFAGLDESGSNAAFVSGSDRIVLGGQSGFHVIDTRSGQTLRSFGGASEPAVISSSGRFAVVSSRAQPASTGRRVSATTTLSLLDLAKDIVLSTSSTPDAVQPLAISGDGRIVVLRILETDVMKLAAQLSAGSAPSNPELRVWNTTGHAQRRLPGITGNLGTMLQAAALSSDGRWLAVEGFDTAVTIYDVSSGAVVHSLAEGGGDWSGASGIAFSTDGRWLARAGQQQIDLWDASNGQRVPPFPGSAVNFAEDGQTLVVGGPSGGAPWLRNLATGREQKLAGGTSGILELALVDDGAAVAAATESGGARYWNLATGELLRSFECTASPVQSVSVDPSHPWLATGCMDGEVLLWNRVTGAKVQTIVTPTDNKPGFTLVRFGPSGQRLVFTRNSELTVWDMAQSRPIAHARVPAGNDDLSERLRAAAAQLPAALAKTLANQLQDPGAIEMMNAIRAIAVAPDGRHIAVATNNSLRLYDAASGEETRELLGSEGEPDGVNSLRFAADGLTLHGVGIAGLESWNVATGSRVKNLAAIQNEDPSAEFDSGPSVAVALSPDGRHVARGHGSLIEIRELDSGDLVTRLKGHTSSISALEFAAAGRTLLSGARDGTVRLWDLPTGSAGRERVQLIALGADDFVTVTPDQYYRASKQRIDGVAFRYHQQLFPFEQFDLRFNRPDIVVERLGRASAQSIENLRSAYARRLKKMGLNENALNGALHLPDLQLTGTPLPLTIAQDTLAVNVRAVDNAVALDRINAYVNDVPVFGSRGIAIKDRTAMSIEQVIRLPLVTGRNKIQLSVLNQQGAESLRQTAYVTSTANTRPPDTYIVAIGVSEYQRSRFNLRYAAKDAADLVQTYKSAAAPGPASGQVYVLDLSNDKATRTNILQAKAWLAQARTNDLVVVFAAGHGMIDAHQQYYFGTYDIDPDQPAVAGLPYEEFETLLDGIAPLRKLLLMDTCFSGEIEKDEPAVMTNVDTRGAGTVSVRSFKTARGVQVTADTAPALGATGLATEVLRDQQQLFADLRRGTGAVVISSASGNEYALEGETWRNGVFTYALLDALRNRNADLNKDQNISVGELESFVIDAVRRLTAGEQNPTVRRENLEFNFSVF